VANVNNARSIGLGMLVVLTLLTAPPAAAQRTAALGTNPPGSILYAVASGLAQVAADAGAARISVQPYSGTSTFLPLLESGELDLGVNNAIDVGLAYRGPAFKIGGANPFPHAPGIRLIMRSAPLLVAPVVRRDSAIKTIHDVKGRRVTGEYRANLAIWYNVFGELASAALTWNDVRVVPVAALNDGVDALVQGRADVTTYGLNGAKLREADAAVGVRHLSIDCSPEGERRLREAVPGYYPRRVKKGEAAAVVEDICVIAYDVYLIAGKGAGDEVVDALLRAIWEHGDKLAAFHPILRDWSRERMAGADVTIPFHPAAVRFFRERGVWTPQTDQAQQRLLGVR
jgi:TRAP transporter TAXI family solute receptor